MKIVFSRSFSVDALVSPPPFFLFLYVCLSDCEFLSLSLSLSLLSPAVTRDAAKEAVKNVPLITSQVEAFEAEMKDIQRVLLGDSTGESTSARLESSISSSSSSSVSSSSSSSSSSPPQPSPSLSPLPSFEEVEAKLSVLRANLRENPLPVGLRLDLERRLAEFGLEMARLKHAAELQKKDAVAAQIYHQLSRATTKGGGGDTMTTTTLEEDEEEGTKTMRKFIVHELTLTLDGKEADDSREASRWFRIFVISPFILTLLCGLEQIIEI